MSDDRHDHDDVTNDSRHHFKEEEEESVVVPSREGYRGEGGDDDDNIWPAERRLYQIFPHETRYAGSTKRSKKTCGGASASGHRLM
jgi:hypothetical protein